MSNKLASQELLRREKLLVKTEDENINLNHSGTTDNLQSVSENNYNSELNAQILDLTASIQAIKASTSWKITSPLRSIAHSYSRLIKIIKIVGHNVLRSGGVKNTLIKTGRLYKNNGFMAVITKLRWLTYSHATAQDDRNNYTKWINAFDTLTQNDKLQIKKEISTWKHKPKISFIMPVYNPPLIFLQRAIESIRSQLYDNWELCIADDASSDPLVIEYLKKLSKEDTRVVIVYRDTNGHISAASNSALKIATGTYIALIDNDDLIPEHALYWVAKEIINNPNAAIIYSDEDKINEDDIRSSPYFKPDWNLYLFRSQNMISHLGVYKKELVDAVGGFRTGFEGSQDYDLALRCVEQIDPKNIIHIAKVLYHWRIHAGSTALSSTEKPYAAIAGIKALSEHLARTNVNATATLLPIRMYRVQYSLPENPPLVTLIIPTRNAKHLVKKCINSILSKTTYPNYEIILIDNGSDDCHAIQYFKKLESNFKIRVLRDNGPFNYSALNNRAVEKASGEVIALINNDVEVISPNWLSEMVALSLQRNVGAVGASLLYPDGRMQHAGVITGLGGVAGHIHRNLPKGQPGYSGRAALIQEMTAVTAACLVIKKTIYNEVGGLNEIQLKVAFNDVDFCLRVKGAGYHNVWTPYAELYHREYTSRGADDTSEKRDRYLQEALYMQERWAATLVTDPAYNPNLTLDFEDLSLAWPPRGILDKSCLN
jgi:glycosyltransferase involved in cell wall biosynthesis